MATKLGKLVTYHEELLLIKFLLLNNVVLYEVMWYDKYFYIHLH